MKPILAAIAALSLAGCTTTGIDPAAPVAYVQSAGGYDVSGTIPPLHYVAAATNALEAGRLTITPMASIAAACGTVALVQKTCAPLAWLTRISTTRR